MCKVEWTANSELFNRPLAIVLGCHACDTASNMFSHSTAIKLACTTKNKGKDIARQHYKHATQLTDDVKTNRKELNLNQLLK
jgi:hypothetical protein